MSRLCSAIWRRNYCGHPIDSSKTTLRCLSTSSPRTLDEQALRQSSHSPRTQNTTEELVRYFDDRDPNQRDDVRRLDKSLPNKPFHRSRHLSTQDQSNTQTQSNQRRPFKNDSYSFRKLDLGASRPSEAEAQTATPSQEPNRPLFRYDNNRQPSPTTNQSPSTRPPRAGALDLRNLSAQPAPNRPTSQRPPPRPANTNRSRGAGSDARRPSGTEAARKAPSSTPRSRPRQPRSTGAPQRPQIYGSSDPNKDTGLSEEEIAYMREKEEARTPQPQPYVPAAVSLESLSGLGAGLPAFGVGAWGQEEAVAGWAEGWERRRLRKRIRSGVWLDGVERFRGAAGVEAEMGDGGRKGGTGEKEIENEDERNGGNGEVLRREFDGRKVAERMFRGEYVFDGKQEEGVLGSLRRQAVRNATYFPQDGKSLAEKVSSLLPAEKTGGGGKTARA